MDAFRAVVLMIFFGVVVVIAGIVINVDTIVEMNQAKNQTCIAFRGDQESQSGMACWGGLLIGILFVFVGTACVTTGMCMFFNDRCDDFYGLSNEKIQWM